MDDFGTEPAALALFHGNRVMYALLVWKALNWPAIAVCQLLRARMELEVKRLMREKCSERILLLKFVSQEWID